MLVFQEDALLCGPSVDAFARAHAGGADYAGAPWDPRDAWVAGKAWLAAVGGNGGLSLRRRSHARACLDAACWQRGQWEDAFYVELLQQLGHRVAPSDMARRFAIERPLVDARGHAADVPGVRGVPGVPGAEEQPCGLHKAYNYLSPHALDAILARIEATYVTLAAAAGLEEAADRPRVQVPVD